MHIIPLLVAFLAVGVFAYDFAKAPKGSRPLVSLGLALLSSAWILSAVIIADSVVTLTL